MEAPLTCTCHVVAMPYPARGHINPMMNLCKLLLSNNNCVQVTFVVTEEWLGLIGSDPKPDNMRLRSIPNVVPSEHTRGNDHIGFIKAVMTKMEAPFEQLLDRLEPPPTIIIFDTFLYWGVAVGKRRNISVASLWTMSASMFSVLHHHHLLEQNGHYPVNLSENGDKRVDYIPGISSMRLADFPLNDASSSSKEMSQLCLKAFAWVPKAQFLLFTSIYELEPQAIDALKSKLSLPIYTIGPVVPYFNVQDNPTSITNGASHSYFEWLNAQPVGSVLYISQGSFFSVSRAQTDEIAIALKESGVRFLWVARSEASRLQEICGNMGIVLTWCDQLKVLCHPAIGGFWSHCGWNSTKEGVFAGVPFLTFPIIMDQPLDSKMIVEDWKVGWRVKEDIQANTLVKKDEIVRLMEKFMDLDSNLTREMREMSKTLQQICRRALSKEGSALTDLNAFIRDIMQV
ncbi:UDP-glycosyltransferase 87A1-like [Abrus precatorius]|uniref:UDP-glycosyltransferase 87A1-like n=1 Tax=Abrus precatorius TaxID=3816 RepID=A0A8B8JNS2_ABRPR|nr:UDP-glycosyltransferase 87A1-like [Abrus precatorius]